MKYTTYEGTEKIDIGYPDTRTEEGWKKYYEEYVMKSEYPTFEGWLWDMLRSGVLEKENNNDN